MKLAPTYAPWWQEEPLTANERNLLNAVLEAHHKSAFRDNVSSDVVQRSAWGAGDFSKALCAATLTTGGLHAPLDPVHDLFNAKSVSGFVRYMIENEHKVPGFGNHFVQKMPDPDWQAVHELLQLWPEIADVIETATEELHNAGKLVFPNPACYTVATAIALGIPRPCSYWIFALGRIDAWAKLFTSIVNA